MATALKHLIAAGVSGDDLVRAVAEMEAAADTRSTAAKKQQRYRDRQAAKRNEASQSVTRVTRDPDPIPPNDIYSNPPENPDGAKAPCPPFAEKVVAVWNDGPGARGATKANPLDAGRRKALAARVREHSEAAVLQAIANLAASDFHCGKNDRGWKVNIGWFLKSPENFAKALEMGGGKPDAPAVKPIDHAAYLASLEDKPWLRGTNTTDPPRQNGTGAHGPRSFGQLAAGIASEARH